MGSAESVAFARIVEALRDEVSRTSIRRTAAAVGMSRRGLSLLLEGTQPHAQTVQKLRRWYVFRQRDVCVHDQEFAVDLLVASLPEERRKNGRDQILKLLGKLRGDGLR